MGRTNQITDVTLPQGLSSEFLVKTTGNRSLETKLKIELQRQTLTPSSYSWLLGQNSSYPTLPVLYPRYY